MSTVLSPNIAPAAPITAVSVEVAVDDTVSDTDDAGTYISDKFCKVDGFVNTLFLHM